MIAYSYQADHTDSWLSNKQVSIILPTLSMPFRKCLTCRSSRFYSHSSPIPESPTPEVRRILKKAEKSEPLSPSQYSELESQIKQLMGFESSRILPSVVRFGDYKVNVKKLPNVDIVLDVVYIPVAILTRKAVDELSRSGLTGYTIYPLIDVGKQNLDLYTIVITGRWGLPTIVKGQAEWIQCPDCKEWWSVGESDKVIFTSPIENDGSDFFIIKGAGGRVHVNEKAKEWLENCSLSLINTFESIEGKSIPPIYTQTWKLRYFEVPKPTPHPLMHISNDATTKKSTE